MVWFPKAQSVVDPIFTDLGKLALRKHGLPWSDLKPSEQAQMIRQALAAQQFTIDPDSEGYLRWMVVMFLTYIYTALVTPYEVSFLHIEKRGILFIVNRIMDAIFACDVVVNFFLKYKIPARNARRYAWVTNRRMIALKYLRCWFWIDLLALSQFDLILFAVSNEVLPNTTHVVERFKIIRLVRLLRLVKVFRRFRKCRFVEICLSKGSASMHFGPT